MITIFPINSYGLISYFVRTGHQWTIDVPHRFNREIYQDVLGFKKNDLCDKIALKIDLVKTIYI